MQENPNPDAPLNIQGNSPEQKPKLNTNDYSGGGKEDNLPTPKHPSLEDELKSADAKYDGLAEGAVEIVKVVVNKAESPFERITIFVSLVITFICCFALYMASPPMPTVCTTFLILLILYLIFNYYDKREREHAAQLGDKPSDTSATGKASGRK